MKTFKILTATAVSLAAAGCLLAAPAMAKDYPDGGVTGAEVVADLTGIGHKAKLGQDSNGNPMIDASFTIGEKKTEIEYRVFLYGCKNGRCPILEYHVAFDGDIKKMPDWNKGYRFARAYNTDATTIHLEYDIDVEKGANTAAIQNTAERWKAIMVQGVTFLSE